MKRSVVAAVAALMVWSACVAEPATVVGKLVSSEAGRLKLLVRADGQDTTVDLALAGGISLPAGAKRGTWLKVARDGEQATAVERGVCPLAQARADQQKLHPWPLSLTIAVAGPKDGQKAELTLGTALDGQPKPAHLAAVAPERAGAMLDYLAAEGFLEFADKPAAPLAGPSCRITLRTDRELDTLAEDAPWTAETRARLDGLRTLLTDATELDALLAATKDWPLVSLVEADVHDGYFVAGEFEEDLPVSFIVLRDRPAFDKVFGAGFVMDDPFHRLPKTAFGDSLVVAAIHRGNAFWEYRLRYVSLLDGVLRLEYSTNVHQKPDASYACPLIVRLPKGTYRAVEFAEDGKVIKRLAM